MAIIEHDCFRELLFMLAPALRAYLAHCGSTIRRWIASEFKRQQQHIQEELSTAKSRIHITLDLWTSPNYLGLCGVVAHYLGKDLKVKSCLIGLRRIRGSHSGENIAEVVKDVLVEYNIISNLGYFCTDNDVTMDKSIRLILEELRPDIINPAQRRLRCRSTPYPLPSVSLSQSSPSSCSPSSPSFSPPSSSSSPISCVGLIRKPCVSLA